jgi:hypothetical protein
MSLTTKSARLQMAGHAQRARMPALIIVMCAAAAYLLFLAVLGYAVGFFAGFGVPKGSIRGRAPPCRSRWSSTCSCCRCSRFSTP